MQGTREIRRRIRTVKSIQQITRAMQMVAASRFKRVERNVLAARPYRTLIREMLQEVVAAIPNVSHPLLVKRDSRRIGLVLISADRGLCGAYNANILRETKAYIETISDREIKLILIGKKGYNFFSKRSYEIIGYEPQPPMQEAFSMTQKIIGLLTKEFETGRLDEVHLFYTLFKTAMSSVPTRLRLLPMESPVGEDNGIVGEPLFEPSAEAIIESLLPRYLEAQVFGALLESAASEQGARMVAMKNATENADEMISDLTMTYNKARQAAITKEILEISSGAEALKEVRKT